MCGVSLKIQAYSPGLHFSYACILQEAQYFFETTIILFRDRG